MMVLARPRRLPGRLLPAALAALALAACGGDPGGTHEIDTVRELPEQRPENQIPRTDAQRFGGGSAGSPHAGTGGSAGAPAAGRSAPGFGWTLPEGWSEKAPTSMRQGNFAIAAAPDAECYLTVLQGTGGGLAANLNRWRKQMGQPDLSPAEIDALERIQLLGQQAHYLEIRGAYSGMGDQAEAGSMMAAVALELPAAAIFVKLVGPTAQVEPQVADFKALTRSIRIAVGSGGAAETPSTPPRPPQDADHGGAAAGHGMSPVRWTVPEGWVVGKARSMRLVTMHPEGNEEAECYLTILASDGGGLAANLNRWRRQMGEDELDAAGIAALPEIEVFGEPTKLLEVAGHFTGMGDRSQEGAMLLGVVAPLQGNTVFVKMTGPGDVVRAEKARFVKFCESLE